MLTAISRYGARVLPNTNEIVAGCKARGEFIQGPDIARFERCVRGEPHGSGHAIATSCGRMGLLPHPQSLDFQSDLKSSCPLFTFWVVPELARVAGLKVVLRGRRSHDVPRWTDLAWAITPATRAVVHDGYADCRATWRQSWPSRRGMA